VSNLLDVRNGKGTVFYTKPTFEEVAEHSCPRSSQAVWHQVDASGVRRQVDVEVDFKGSILQAARSRELAERYRATDSSRHGRRTHDHECVLPSLDRFTSEYVYSVHSVLACCLLLRGRTKAIKACRDMDLLQADLRQIFD
jgi:hypothetical protein